jgi:Mrp family chromosome partitioning ATPase
MPNERTMAGTGQKTWADAAVAYWRRGLALVGTHGAVSGKPASRSYRYLARQLEGDLPAANGGRVIVLSGACTTAVTVETALMLATALTDELDCTVLLIDEGLNEGGLAERLGLDQLAGWRDLLHRPEGAALRHVVHCGYPGLALLPAGAAPAEQGRPASARRIGALFDELRGSFDYIMLVQGPVTADSRHLVPATLAQLVLLLVEENETRFEVLDACRRTFGDCGVNDVRLLLSAPASSAIAS